MTFYQEITSLQERIARAHVERDAWRATGMQEKYLEAHSMVDALELQLEAMRLQGLRASAKNDASFADTSPPAVASSPGERERLMSDFAIEYNGRQYQYDRYRYDRLDDAVSYARLQRAMPSGHDAAVPTPAAQSVEAPDEAQREMMAAWSITFQDGIYHLGAYRYERLADAVSYARLLRTQVK